MNCLPSAICSMIFEFTDNPFLIRHFLESETKFFQECANQLIHQSLLDEFGITYSTFLTKFLDAGAVIGGSWIASKLANNLHNDSDIDIFIPTLPKLKILSEILRKRRNFLLTAESSVLLEWFYATHPKIHMTNRDGYDWEGIRQVFSTNDLIGYVEDEGRKKAIQRQSRAFGILCDKLKDRSLPSNKTVCKMFDLPFIETIPMKLQHLAMALWASKSRTMD
jgi:hypothetical protein